MAVAITKRVTVVPNGLSAIKRENWKFSVTWKIPSAATNEKRNDRWETQQYRWAVFVYDKRAKKKKVVEWTAKRVCKSKISLKTTSASYSLNVNDFYPNHAWRCIDRVEFFVEGKNRKGLHKNNDKVKPYSRFYFSPPAKPKLSVNVNDDTNAVECTITNTDPGVGVRAERRKTQYRIYRQDAKGVAGGDPYVKKKEIYKGEYNSSCATNNKFISRNDSGIQQRLQYGQWSRIYWRVINRGVQGDTDPVEISHVFAYPAKATIQKIVLSNTKNAFDPTGSVSVWIKTNHNADTAPVDKVQLQRLRNVTAATAAAAAIESGWTDVEGAVDNRTCYGLSDNSAEAIPDVGKHTWYRIKSTHDSLTSYSSPVEAKAFFRKEATAADDSVTIISCNGDRDGTSIEVKLGWKNDDATGTEISWAEFEDAWSSTSQPSTYRVTWKDASSTDPRFNNTASVIIRGLSEGTKYYIKARRYLAADGGKETFGKYNSAPQVNWPTTPSHGFSGSELKDVQLYIQQPVVRGRDTSASWTYDSEDYQSGWELHAIRTVPEYTDTIIASGTDSMTSTVIKSDIFQNDTDLAFKLRMTTGGNWVENINDVGTGSESNKIQIFDHPNYPVFGAFNVYANPVKLYLKSKTAIEEFVITIRSQGSVQQHPAGVRLQAEGDVVYSNRVVPAWTAVGEEFSAIVTLPNGIDFIDKGVYIVEVTAIDPIVNLTSDMRQSVLRINWEHQAMPPSTSSKVVANPNAKSVTIVPQAPENYMAGDVCDIYRMTPDGAQCIAEGITFGASVVDRWAPYSKIAPLFYRLATRTSDGDIEFLDIPYNLNGYAIRFDWGGDNSLEVPYNLRFNDAYSTDFEKRQHLNGERAGFWNSGYNRSSSASTQMVRLDDPEQVRLTRELAQYPGAVFARFPNGCAFMANVDVKGIDENYDSLVLDVSFEITEVVMTEEFKVSPTDISLV